MIVEFEADMAKVSPRSCSVCEYGFADGTVISKQFDDCHLIGRKDRGK